MLAQHDCTFFAVGMDGLRRVQCCSEVCSDALVCVCVGWRLSTRLLETSGPPLVGPLREER